MNDLLAQLLLVFSVYYVSIFSSQLVLAFKCPRPGGLFPAGGPPTSCGKYYECEHGNPTLRSCPDDQGFHSSWRQCAWKGFVQTCYTKGQICGMTVEDGDAGSADARKETPWMVAVFQRDRTDQDWQFITPAVIIGPTTAITSCRLGRMVNEKWRFNTNASSFQVYAATESLDLTTTDEFAQILSVNSVQLNPKSSENAYEFCSAILHLKTPFNFSGPFVRPLCLPLFNGPSKSQQAFGYSGNGKISTYRELAQPSDGYSHLRSASFKLTSRPFCFAHTYDRNKYCAVTPAGGSDIINVCMVHQTVSAVQAPQTKRWYALGYGSHFNNEVCGIRSLEDDYKLPWISRSLRCGASKFPCNDGKCIDLDDVCNNQADCSKGEDENPRMCRAMNPCINDATFECGVYENCILPSKVCDGYPDCYDASDENPQVCKNAKRKNNVPFYATNQEVPAGPEIEMDSTMTTTTTTAATTPTEMSDPKPDFGDTSAVQEGSDVSQPKPKQRKCPEIDAPEGAVMSCLLPGNPEFGNCSKASYVVGAVVKFRCNNFYRPVIPSEGSLIKKCMGDSRWKPERNLICVPDCGRLPSSTATNAYIVNGQKANALDRFPWHVAIFVKQRAKQEYICGGTLIHRGFVLTAAHCVTNYNGNNNKEPSTFTVALAPASSNYSKLTEKDPKARLIQVRKISVNPHYDQSNNYQSDMALLALSHYAELDESVMISCLPSQASSDPLPGTIGKVCGFGFDESGTVSDSLRFANLPIVSTEACRDAVGFVPSVNQFCAGYSNGTGVCFGDSGGGLVVLRDDRFYLQGIVSVGPKVERVARDLTCDHNTFAVYTSVPRFVEWIYSTMNVIEMDS